MLPLTFDLETIPTDDPEDIADIAAGIKPPGNISKPETIAKWHETEKPAAIAEAIARTSFDALYGRICCIGYAFGDGVPSAHCHDDERELISGFFDMVANRVRDAHVLPKFIGHNISGFDLPFLFKRAVILGIKPPTCIPFSAKPWSEAIGDTMLMWDSDKTKRVSLDRLCRALGVPTSKSKMDGSQVAEYWRAGRRDEIAAYCAEDVAATRAVYQRLTFGAQP